MQKFRKLRAEEIDCRVSQIEKNWCTLLLYKDARVDQNILDETVGCMNWQKRYESMKNRYGDSVSFARYVYKGVME